MTIRIWVIASLVLGMAWMIVIPPFGAPDEAAHFYRAWYVSKGHFTATLQDGTPGVVIPPELLLLKETFRWRREQQTFPFEAVRPALRAPAASEPERFYALPSHSYSSGLGYIPQAIGIALGRAAGASPLTCFYLARFCNLLVGVALIALALHFFPAYRWLVTILALTPLAAHVRSSLSLDVVTMGLAFLFIALVTRALFVDAPVSPRVWTAITILGGLLCMTKINYLPIVALALLVPAKRFATARAAWISRGALIAVAAAGSMIATAIATHFYAPYRLGDINPQLQTKYILDHPLQFLSVLKVEYVNRAKWYLISMVGDLGSGEYIVVLPKVLVTFYFLAILVLLLTDTNPELRITPWQRVWFTILCAGSAIAVALAIYTTWNPVGWDRIDGLQGRYYLPFVPAAAFIVHRAARGLRERARAAIAIVVIVVSSIVALHVSVKRWYAEGWRAFTSSRETTPASAPVRR